VNHDAACMDAEVKAAFGHKLALLNDRFGVG